MLNKETFKLQIEEKQITKKKKNNENKFKSSNQ